MRTLILCLALSFIAAPAVAQDYPRSHASAQSKETAQILRGFELIQTWQIPQARAIVAKILKKEKIAPLEYALVAEMRFHLSDYQGAVTAFDKARAGGAPESLLMSETSARAALEATKGYQEYVGEHFIIRHPPGKDAILVPFAEEALNKARENIGKLLGYIPEDKIVLEIYPSANTLAQVSSLSKKDIETSGTIALCRWNRLMATTPRAVVFGYAWRDTLAHELAHLLIGRASKNTVPIWLHEGLAKFTETAWRDQPGLGISVSQQKALVKAAKANKLIPFKKMHPSMAKLKSQEDASLAFSEVFTFIEFLVAKGGWESIRKTIKLMSKGGSDKISISKVFGTPFSGLDKQWRTKLKKRPIRKLSGMPVKGSRKLVIKKSDTPDDQLHGLSRKARRFARAADLLFSRGRMTAAQIELEKAFRETKSPLVSNKLAVVALANNDLKKAEQAARAALEGTAELAGPNITLAEVLVRGKKVDEAELPLSRAIDINPFDPRIHQLTLVILAERQDAQARIEHARQALMMLQNKRKAQAKDLGRGARIIVQGPPLSRIYVHAPDGSGTVATGFVTPSPIFDIKPGRYELEVVPHLGPAQRRKIEVAAGDKPQVFSVSSTPK